MSSRKKTLKERRDALLDKYGLDRCNQFKRDLKNKKKSHKVLACQGEITKFIRFGQEGVKGEGKNPKTAAGKKRRNAFYARHGKNIAKGKLSAAYWSAIAKW